MKKKGARKLLVEESVYTLNKRLKKGSVSINSPSILPGGGDVPTTRSKLNAILRAGKGNMTPNATRLNLNQQSQVEFDDPRVKLNLTMTENMWTGHKTGRDGTANYLRTEDSQLPSLNQQQMLKTGGSISNRRTSQGVGQQFFFATRTAGESVGEKEDPRLARRLKLSQVVLREGSQHDPTLANMIYGTQINTQKNLIGARSIRKSL